MKILRRNIRRFILYIRLKNMDEALPVGQAFGVAGLLKLLKEIEDKFGEKIQEKFFVVED
jgi:hypothetical protein